MKQLADHAGLNKQHGQYLGRIKTSSAQHKMQRSCLFDFVVCVLHSVFYFCTTPPAAFIFSALIRMLSKLTGSQDSGFPFLLEQGASPLESLNQDLSMSTILY